VAEGEWARPRMIANTVTFLRKLYAAFQSELEIITKITDLVQNCRLKKHPNMNATKHLNLVCKCVVRCRKHKPSFDRNRQIKS